MPIGTLRDQVIYPDSPGDMMSKGLGDSDLADLLDKVQLRYLLDREETTGWDTERDWMDTLSGGSKHFWKKRYPLYAWPGLVTFCFTVGGILNME